MTNHPRRSPPLAAALAAALAAGCGSAPDRPARSAADADGPVPVRELEAALAGAGLEPAADDLTGFLVERGSEPHAVEVPAGRCLTLAARAAAGIRDIDTRLYGPDGALLAEDVEPDAHPTIQACAGDEPLSAWLVVYAYAGNGSYRVLVWGGDAASVQAARAVVGGNPGFAGGGPGEAKPGAPAPWEGFAGALGQRGYEAVGEPVRVTLPADGSPLRRPFPVEVGWCYAAAVFPVGGGGPAFRLRVETGWGDPRVGSDQDDGFHAVQLCPDESGTWALLVEGPGGGSAVVTTHRAPEADAGSVLWLGDPAPSVAGAPGFLGTASAALRDEGYGPTRVVSRGPLGPGQAVTVPVSLAGGVCAAFALAPADGLGTAHLSIRDGDGRLLGESVPWASPRAGGLAVACPGSDTDAVLHVVARRGAGAYTLFRAVGGDVTLPERHRAAKGAVASARVEARRSGAVRVEAPEAAELGPGETRAQRLAIAAGSCGEVALLATEGSWDAAIVRTTPDGVGGPVATARGPRIRLVGCRGVAGPPLALELAAADGAVAGVVLLSTKPSPR